MKITPRVLIAAVTAVVVAIILPPVVHRTRQQPDTSITMGSVLVHRATHDLSLPLATLRVKEIKVEPLDCDKEPHGCGASPGDPDADADPDDQPQQTTQQQTVPAGGNPQRPAPPPAVPPPPPPVPPAAVAVEQQKQGDRAALAVVSSFDGLGFGFNGPQGPGRNAALDNSLAVGPDHIIQVINGAGIAVYTKKGAKYDTTGKVLYGAVASRTVFKDFGGPCETANFGDVVVRYDQLADRWLYVMPIFQKIPNRPEEPYSVCYALSQTPDPLGAYYRYEFRRKLFPDYPRPAIWTDGYYVPSSTGDNVIQKHDCIVDRTAMLKGKAATEQCLIIDGVNFLNNADIEGQALPAAGAPNIMLAAGGSQLKQVLEDDGLYVWKVHVDWQNPKNTGATGPTKIPVAPYHYLCNGQLTNCVPQPGTTTRLDAQGDKLMQRLVYRNFGDHESLVSVHSINSSVGAGGVRWYELRLDPKRDAYLYQQGTYAPDDAYRWMASPDMDHAGNIGIGYSYGGTPRFVGQRFAARLAGDPLGQMSFHETVLVEGEGVQARGNRWTDYASTAMDPSDDCTFWYVGDYFKAGAPALTTKIGAFRMPGCMTRTVTGSVFYDVNHNGKRDPGEAGIEGVQVQYAGGQSGKVATGTNGNFSAPVPADPLYGSDSFTISANPSSHAAWAPTTKPVTLSLGDPKVDPTANFGSACSVAERGGQQPSFWAGAKGKAILNAHDPAWRTLVQSNFHLDLPDKPSQAYDQFKKWLGKPSVSTQLASLSLSVNFGNLDGKATVADPVTGDWFTINELVARVSALKPADAEPYRGLIEKLNKNSAQVTPSSPGACGGY